MSIYAFILMLCMTLISTKALPQNNAISNIEWKKLVSLSNADGSASIGFAGAINGINRKALIVAGGANFPEKMPWEGGEKFYSDEIHVIKMSGGEYMGDRSIVYKLPEPIAYSGTTSTPKGIVYAGGENREGLSKKTYIINWKPLKKTIEIKALPDLPVAITNAGLTSIKNVVYLVGGDEAKASSSAFYHLNLSSKKPQWEMLPDLPVKLANSTTIAQHGVEGTNIYVIGGRTKNPSGISDLHNTVYIFNPKSQRWKQGTSISDGTYSTTFSAGSGVAVASKYIVLTGGDTGEVFHEIETRLLEIAMAVSPAEKERLTAFKNKLVVDHKGFFRGMLLYNTSTNSWSKIGELPFPAQVTSTAVKWGDKIILSSGEVRPGIRTPNVMIGKVK